MAPDVYDAPTMVEETNTGLCSRIPVVNGGTRHPAHPTHRLGQRCNWSSLESVVRKKGLLHWREPR